MTTYLFMILNIFNFGHSDFKENIKITINLENTDILWIL